MDEQLSVSLYLSTDTQHVIELRFPTHRLTIAERVHANCYFLKLVSQRLDIRAQGLCFRLERERILISCYGVKVDAYKLKFFIRRYASNRLTTLEWICKSKIEIILFSNFIL